MSTRKPSTKHFEGLKAGNIFEQMHPGIAEAVKASLAIAAALRDHSDPGLVKLLEELRNFAEGVAKASQAWEGIQDSPFRSAAEGLFPSRTVPQLHVVGQLYPMVVKPAMEALNAEFPKDRRSIATMFENMHLVRASELVIIETGGYGDEQVAALMAKIYTQKTVRNYKRKKIEDFEKALPARRQRLKRGFPLLYQQARQWAEEWSSQSRAARPQPDTRTSALKHPAAEGERKRLPSEGGKLHKNA